MDSTIDLSSVDSALNLANIRFQLIRLEDTITFHLIERVQFPLNGAIYKPMADGGVASPVPTLSLCDWILREHERLHSLVRRYQAPDEHAFFPEALQPPVLDDLHYPAILHAPSRINVNAAIRDAYIHRILPVVCGAGSEQPENYGSAATCDVLVLQAISRRIHFGMFVAESKFRQETARFVDLIRRKDEQGIVDAITKPKVERKILERLRLKAKTYSTDPERAELEGPKINVEAVSKAYEDVIIPLTKEVEVKYLLTRLVDTEWDAA